MKLYCLSRHPNKPCHILKFKNTTIMLDCGLDMTSLTYFLPTPVVCSPRISGLPVWRPKDGAEVLTDNELKECAGRVFIDSSPEFVLPEAGITSFDEVDVILISNYQCMLALPFITEGTGFTGVIYATEPTLQMGRLFMEELVHYIDRTPRANNATKWKLAEIFNSLPQNLKSAKKSHLWRQCYRMPEVNASLARVQVVGFSQKLTLFGALHLIPVSSGYCLGSCNWTISSEYEKITYVSGSSTLTTHPKPMEQGPLRRSDILILTGLTQTPTANPDTMLGEFCVTVALTLRNNGSVLVPCYPSGVTYDLFECLSSHLDSSGLTTIPMFFISPVADSSLAFSNIMAEWLSQAKQSKVYLPEEPFPHAQLVKNNRLKHYTSIHAGLSNDFRTPCIVFTGHPSLRFGDVVHFMEIWGKNSNNTVVFTEPDFPYLEALSPYQPLAMKAVYTPIDTSLNFSQVNKLIKELKPLHLVVPEQYTVPPLMHQHRSELVIETDVNMLVYKDSQVLTLPIRRVYERVEIDPEIATALVPTEIKPGVSVATITGTLSIMDNRHILKPLVKLPKAGGTNRKRRQEDENRYPQCYMWGSLDIDEFISQLAKNGITDVKKEDTAAGYMLHLQAEDTLIQIEEGSTHIFCEADETLRKKLRDILLQCLSKF